MNQRKNTLSKTINSQELFIKMLLGAATGLIIISLFVFSVDHPKPYWGDYWRIRPLLVTPIAGAMGGMYLYILKVIFAQNKWKTVLIPLLGCVGFIIALWLGIVLGLDGTLWN